MLPKCVHTYQNHHLDSLRWQHFVPRSGDIVVSTSYKSGTTLTQEIVRQLIFHCEDPSQWRSTPLSSLAPWLDMRVSPVDEVIARLEAQTHRRSIKTHLALDGLPFFPQLKYIVVGRDARDVFMSLWNHYACYTPSTYERLNHTPGRVGAPLPLCNDDIHATFRAWMSQGWFAWEYEGYPFWGNLHHTQSWWDYRHLDNIYFVHYGDLITDLRREVLGIANFLEITITDNALDALLPNLSLEAMRDNDLRLGGKSMWEGGPNTFFFKGTNGRWRGMLTSEDLALYDMTAARVLTLECRQWLEQGRAAFATGMRQVET